MAPWTQFTRRCNVGTATSKASSMAGSPHLSAAGVVLPGDSKADDAEPETDDSRGAFRYTKRVLDGHTAVLEFETTVGDVHVNGVDIITCDDDSMITEFKVMMRPHRALDTVRQQMAMMLEKMSAQPPVAP